MPAYSDKPNPMGRDRPAREYPGPRDAWPAKASPAAKTRPSAAKTTSAARNGGSPAAGILTRPDRSAPRPAFSSLHSRRAGPPASSARTTNPTKLRATAIRSAAEFKVALKKGRNRVLFRLNQKDAQWQAAIRFRTTDDKLPGIKGIPFAQQERRGKP